MSCAPLRLAAIWACRSDSTSERQRVPEQPGYLGVRVRQKMTMAGEDRRRGVVDEVLDELVAVVFALVDDLEGHDLGALLEDGLGGRRHGPGEQAANVGMMAAGGGKEDEFALVVHGRDQSDVGQVGAARGWVVGHDHVAGLDVAAQELLLVSHGEGHGTEVDGQVRGIGDEVAVGREDGAGEIQSLFDISRDGRLPQCRPHGFRHGHETVGEQAEQQWVRWHG
jgi:hypothetical protein